MYWLCLVRLSEVRQHCRECLAAASSLGIRKLVGLRMPCKQDGCNFVSVHHSVSDEARLFQTVPSFCGEACY